MFKLSQVYAIWLREFTVFLREKERVISSIVMPLLWIIGFGGGLGATVSVGGVNYQEFVFPGIIAMSVLFTSMFYGMYIIWDRKLDFLKAVLVAPVPRSAVFFGKMLGGMTDVMVQALALVLIGVGLSLVDGMIPAALALAGVLAVSACIVSLGLIIGANMKSIEGFNLVMSFITWPMFIFSGALFPTENLPAFLDVIVAANPLTYGVDLLRLAVLGTTKFGLVADLGVLALATALFAFAGIKSFERMQI